MTELDEICRKAEQAMWLSMLALFISSFALGWSVRGLLGG